MNINLICVNLQNKFTVFKEKWLLRLKVIMLQIERYKLYRQQNQLQKKMDDVKAEIEKLKK